MSRTPMYVLLVVMVVVGMAAPAAAAPAGTTGSAAVGSAAPAAMVQANNSTNGTNVTVGQQLSTVVDVSSDEVQSDFERTEFEAAMEGADEERRAELIAERADELRESATDIHEEYTEATAAYREGEFSKSEYAQRIATLNARASNLLDSYEQLQRYAGNVSALELRSAGYEASRLTSTMDRLDNVTGAGATALLKRFTGESSGEFDLETTNGLSVEVESEGGEFSREVERPRDDDRNITVNQSAALDTARAALSAPENGSWVLTSASVREEEGAYAFTFALKQAPGKTGEAEVNVDGSSGKVYSLEEEIERRDEADDEAEEDESAEAEGEGELALVVAQGTPAPNETITVKALSNGTAVSNVTVFLNGEAVGTTGPDGTVTVTLPAAEETTLSAETDAGEAELEFEFEQEEEDEVFRDLQVRSSLDDGTVTVHVSYNGTGVPNATVYANGEAVGTTDADGTTSFAIDTNTTDELELEIVRGAFEAELSYTVQDGTLTMTESAHEGDGDKSEEEEREDEEAEEDEETDEGTETDDDSDETETEEETEPEDDADETETDVETETDEETDDDADETETDDEDDGTEEPDETDTESP